MTKWKKVGWDKEYKERLGHDVFKFIEKDSQLIEYLSDYDYITKNLINKAKEYQLVDNSMFVLIICKLFEGVLILLANEAGWINKFSKGNSSSIRKFFLDNRKEIEKKIQQKSPRSRQKIMDKLYSTVDDFTERNKAVHYGSFINYGEVANYDAILTKIRDIVKILIDNKIVK